MGKTIQASLIVLFLVSHASAQTPQGTDPRWIPWLGCWQLIDESVRERGNGGAAPQVATAVSVCVLPTDGPAAVTLKTAVATQSTFEQTIVADGADHPVTDANCRGTQRAEWSNNGKRLLARAQVVCEDQLVRKISGLTMIDGNGTWVDVQAMDVGGQESIRVRRYRQSPEQRVATGPAALSSSAALTLDEVKEATGKLGKVSPGVIEAALFATGTRFVLNSRRLIDLDDAGVPPSVIDWIVALAYPDRFVIEGGYAGRVPGVTDAAFRDSFFASRSAPYYSFNPYDFYPYDRYDYSYGPYYYSPFAYSYSGPAFGSFVFANATGSPDVPNGAGRVINGVGYVRIRPREADNTGSGGGQIDNGSSTTRDGSSGRSEGSDSSTGSPAAATSGGYSGGSSSSDSGRTAQPR